MTEVKLKDIAQALGVSTVTVSNALSGKKGVSDKMRVRIRETAEAMGYDMLKYERQTEGNRIGVLVGEKYLEIGVSFYWAMYQKVAYMASRHQGVTVLETVTRENEQTRRLPKIVEEQTVDGLIVIGWMEKDYVSRLVEDSGIPVVLLDFNLKDVRCDAVMSNNYMGMYKATRYLLEHGHCDIAFVGSVHANDNIMDRYFGYCKALYEKGIRVRREWMLEDRDIESGDMKVALPDNMPTAFACSSDLAAGYLYDALVEKGYRIPEDISIVAYDNYLFGHPFAEQLTTYNVDMERMGASAMKLLLGKIRGVEKYYGVRYIDSDIVERRSVRTVPWSRGEE